MNVLMKDFAVDRSAGVRVQAQIERDPVHALQQRAHDAARRASELTGVGEPEPALCVDGDCVECGGDGQACCDGGVCKDDGFCADGICDGRGLCAAPIPDEPPVIRARDMVTWLSHGVIPGDSGDPRGRRDAPPTGGPTSGPMAASCTRC